MKPGNSNTAIVVAFLGALVVTGLILFLAVPAYQASVATEDKLVETESQVQAQYASRKKLSETTERLKSARKIIDQLKSQFLPNGEELELITAVEGIGDKQGVTTRLTMDQGKGLPGLTDYNKTYSLSIVGPYTKVMDALIDFERLPFLATYSTLTLNAGSNETGTAGNALTLELRGYVASPPQKL